MAQVQAVALPIGMNAVAHPVVNAEPPKKRRKPHHINGALPKPPKRPVNAYSMFLKDYFRQMGAGANPTTMLEASQQWRTLPDDRKVEYEAECAEDKARYVAERTLWNQQKAFLKRPASAYALFLKDTWAEEKANGTVGEKGVADMGKLASERWRAMAPEEKDVYKTRHLDLMDQRTVRLNELSRGNVVSTPNGLEVRAAPAPDQGPDPDLDQPQPAAVAAAAEQNLDEEDEDFDLD